jgi:asparagine synthase (glutamine-hydrolysing)
MSVQFGLWNFNHAPVSESRIANARAALAPYTGEGVTEYSDNETQLLYLPYCVTPESAIERQPFVGSSGQVVVWDGRLDNRQELIGTLHTELRGDLTDVAIVAAALECWGAAALAKLVGDWALAVWNPRERTVLLAKDFLGTKSLYYTISETTFAWSTLLDPLLPSNNELVQLQKEYVAGWFSHFPATHLTPFAGIHSVPSASYLLFRSGKATLRQHWNFDPHKGISYRDDREYEEHFRTVFGESVRRRLRAAAPVLAELSGGMDSSSIVCMADALMTRGFSETPRLDTISCFDSSEPNWNELPFFELVEQRRGRAGHRVAVDFRKYWHPLFDPLVFAATPGSGKNLNETADYESAFRSGSYRVLLQGIGGDEVLGGVPTPLPELADLLARGRGRASLRQSIAWALASRTPALHLLVDTLKQFLPDRLAGHSFKGPTWLGSDFANSSADALNGYADRFHIFGALPSFQANIASLETLRRHISAFGVSPRMRAERRYPFLDRDLLEFVFAIPRDQLVRPHHRRSLMRRALVEIVPAEILNRRRKAFIARGPLASLRTALPQLLEDTKNMTSSRLGIVDDGAFRVFLKRAADVGDLSLLPALRTLLIEAWLTNLVHWKGSLRFSESLERSLPRARDCELGLHGFFS